MPEIMSKRDIMQSPEYAFMTLCVETAMKSAKRLYGCTDSYLRGKMASHKAAMKFAYGKAKEYLAENTLNTVLIRGVDKEDPIKVQYSELMTQYKYHKKKFEFYQDILYSRLYLKEDKGIVQYFVGLTDETQVKRRMEQMKRIFPE